MKFSEIARAIADQTVNIAKIVVGTAGNITMSMVSPIGTVIITAASASTLIYDSIKESNGIAKELVEIQKKLKELKADREEEKHIIITTFKKILDYSKAISTRSAAIVLGSSAILFLLLYIATAVVDIGIANDISGWIASGLAGATVLVPGLMNLVHNIAMKYQIYQAKKEIKNIENDKLSVDENESSSLASEDPLSSDAESKYEIAEDETEERSPDVNRLREKLEKAEQELADTRRESREKDESMLDANRRIIELETELKVLRSQQNTLSANSGSKPQQHRT